MSEQDFTPPYIYAGLYADEMAVRRIFKRTDGAVVDINDFPVVEQNNILHRARASAERNKRMWESLGIRNERD